MNKRFNLLPQKGFEGVSGANLFGRFLAASIVLLLIFILFSFLQLAVKKVYAVRASAIEKQIRDAKKDIEYARAEKEKMDLKMAAWKAKNEKLEGRINFLTRERGEKMDYSEILKALNAYLPKDVWISKITLERGMSKVAGSTYSNALVSSFMSNLEKSPYFDSVRFRYTEKGELDGRSVINFEVSFAISEHTEEAGKQ